MIIPASPHKADQEESQDPVRLRILYILTSLGIGGAEKQVTALAERMAAKGHSVTLLVLKHSSEEWPTKLPVMRLNLKKTPSGIWRGLQFAHQFCILFRPDVLHSHTFPANLFARLMQLRKLDPSPILINTIHNVYEGGWHRMALYRLTDPLVNRITAVSQAAADRFLRLHAVSPRKLSILTNGIDTTAFSPVAGRYKAGRKQMHVDAEFVWIAIGRLVPAKDYPTLLTAFSMLQGAHPDARLWIVGAGNPDAILQSANRSVVPDGVQFLGLRTDIHTLLAAADGYVLSSAWEGLPLATAEAMAMQKPVVATDVGGVRELVAETGLLVPAGNSEALANAMQQIMRMNPLERKMLGRDARRRVESHFSLSAKADEWEAFYRSYSGEARAE